MIYYTRRKLHRTGLKLKNGDWADAPKYLTMLSIYTNKKKTKGILISKETDYPIKIEKF